MKLLKVDPGFFQDLLSYLEEIEEYNAEGNQFYTFWPKSSELLVGPITFKLDRDRA